MTAASRVLREAITYDAHPQRSFKTCLKYIPALSSAYAVCAQCKSRSYSRRTAASWLVILYRTSDPGRERLQPVVQPVHPGQLCSTIATMGAVLGRDYSRRLSRRTSVIAIRVACPTDGHRTPPP